MAVGRLDARITVPGGGWAVSWTDTAGGPLTATVAAGNYYPRELAAALQAAIIALAGTVGDNATVSLSDGESGTGRTTIAVSSGTYSLTWTSTDLRDALGFTANVTTQASVTGTQHARGLWLPGAPAKFSMYGDAANGTLVTDFRSTVGPSGIVNSMYGTSFRKHVGIKWAGVPNTRALAHFETVVNASFEAFFRDAALGRLSYIPVGTYIRLVWDAASAATGTNIVVGRLLWPATFDLEQFVQGWTGRWTVSLPTLVVES